MTPEQRIAIKHRIWAEEAAIPWLYRDSAVEGNATCGVGHLVPSPAAASALPFHPSITAREWALLMSSPRGCRASFYQGYTQGRLSPADMDALLDADLAATERQLVAELPDYPSYPGFAQQALLDMAFNLGVEGLMRFTLLICAAKSRDWAKCAAECHRRGISEQRNQDTAELFQLAAQQAA